MTADYPTVLVLILLFIVAPLIAMYYITRDGEPPKFCGECGAPRIRDPKPHGYDTKTGQPRYSNYPICSKDRNHSFYDEGYHYP